ncbi:MAG: hypothetical protein JNN01_12635 [Opitutaceae bacterium]|nr:hypothetical protein [Opitutaceae bacterium]
MSTNNNTTLTFVAPLPEAANASMQEILEASGFSHDWDEATAVLDQLPPGVVTLFARNCPYDERCGIIDLAKRLNFSVILHCEDLADFAGDATSDIVAFDATTSRDVSFAATNNSHQPLLRLDQCIGLSRAEFKQFLLPKDILEAQGEDAPNWCKMLQTIW